MDVDPLASMRCWAIEIELGGRTFEIPALPAVDWWPVLVSADLAQILDFVVSMPDDPLNLDDLLLTGAVSGDALTEALIDAVEEATGRSLHASIVLAAVAANSWATVNGELAQRGFRWDIQPIGAALDAIYAVVTSRMEKEPLDKFLALLENEALTTGKAPSGRRREKALADFEAMAGPRPTPVAATSGEPSGSGRPKTRTRPRPRLQDGPSREPRRPRAGRAGSGPAASFGSRGGEGGPASGTEPPPPPSAR
jgi:hypothetical protein